MLSLRVLSKGQLDGFWGGFMKIEMGQNVDISQLGHVAAGGSPPENHVSLQWAAPIKNR